MLFEHAVLNPQKMLERRMILHTPLPGEDAPAKLALLLER